MKTETLRSAYFACGLALLLAGCSAQGPDVVDPQTNRRAQTVLLAVDKGSSSELYRYNELSDVLTPNDYSSANNGEELGKKVDAIYENDERLFLHHREEGEITMLDFSTRKKIATLSGFPGGVEGQMCSMAFSNYSQAWVVCYNTPKLFQVDQYLQVVADTFDLEGNPTNVGTNGTYVFVSMLQSDGTAKVGIFESNFVNFSFKKTITLPSPVIYSTPTSDNFEFVLITAGGPGMKPKAHFVRMDNLEISDELEIESDPLTEYVGKEPNFAAYTRDDFLYLALPSMVIQFDVRSRYYNEWYTGYHPIIGVDFATSLFYAYAPGSQVIKRRTAVGEDLADLSVGADVRSIYFLGTNTQVR